MSLAIVLGIVMVPFFLWVLSELVDEVKKIKQPKTKAKKDWYLHE